MKKEENKTKYIIGMVISMIFWGIAWTSGKVTMQHTVPQVAAFWRYAISFITIIPVVWYMKVSFKADKVAILYMILAGILSATFNYLFFIGLSHGQAGYGGTMVTSLVPLLTYFLSIVLLGTKVNKVQVFGLCIGSFGALILLRVPMDGFAFLNVDSSYFLLAALVWSLVTILAQKVSSRANPMLYTLVVFGITAFVNMIFALPYHPFEFASLDSVFWWNILFIGLLSGTFSMTLFFISASHLGAHKTGVFMFIVPIGAIISSWIVYDEEILLSTIIGCFFAFLSVVVFNFKRKVKIK
ncbi:EamA family transporter [Arcobacter sp. CECT 8986]|uniref:DMT family transporter n=1 Tax=Arcobacter sp. CECT 8986 TaxID=2044507 RepID=UPI001009C9E4|nr:DMT family transporter [Arcobacter sp. CECT 8986]RXK00511.1 EamA family transporter [Arcobacter sp. CECT 8986]